MRMVCLPNSDFLHSFFPSLTLKTSYRHTFDDISLGKDVNNEEWGSTIRAVLQLRQLQRLRRVVGFAARNAARLPADSPGKFSGPMVATGTAGIVYRQTRNQLWTPQFSRDLR